MRIPFGRRAAANVIGRQITKDMTALRQAATRTLPPAVDRAGLERLCYDGDGVLAQVRARAHGETSHDEIDRASTQAFLSAARRMRDTLTRPAPRSRDTPERSTRTVPNRVRARGEVVDIRETGMTVNDDPRVRLRVRVFPPDVDSFEVERKLLVSRLAIPRRDDRVEVEYDPDEPDRFTFELADATPGLAEELAELAALHSAGALTEEEFQRAKSTVLGGETGPTR